MNTRTFPVTSLFSRTFWLSLALLFLLGGATELAARTAFFQAPLTPPKMGSRHYQLGHKLALLDADVKQNGPVDCIILGSSMVDVGFDPESFQTGYHEIAGQRMRCFNFGIDSSSMSSTAALVHILMQEYDPRFLIVGTDPRDYAVPDTESGPAAIVESSWVKYRLGGLSLEGWLLDHSYLYRYRQHLSRLMHFTFENTLWSETQLNFPILPNGYTQITKISTDINNPPDPQDTSYEVTYYRSIFSSYQMLEENLSALEDIMDYNGSETRVILVEMPVSDGLYYFFGNGETDYNLFINRVDELANLYQVTFWRTEPLDSIPDNGWSDYSHLNVTGAEIFSNWLGEQVGRLDAWNDANSLQP